MRSKTKEINEMDIEFMETDDKIVLLPNSVFRLGKKRLGLSNQEIDVIYKGVIKTKIVNQEKLNQLKEKREKELKGTRPGIYKGKKFIQKDSYVYFILDKSSNAVKIGHTTNLEIRLMSLRSMNMNKLELIYAIEGDVKLELGLHTRFSKDQIKNEWFNYSNDIKAYIKSRSTLPHPPSSLVTNFLHDRT